MIHKHQYQLYFDKNNVKHSNTILEVLINIDLDEDIEIKNKILIQYFSSYITSFIF
jgi:hypothetical protein